MFICQPGGVGDVVDMSVTTNDGGQIEPILGQDSFDVRPGVDAGVNDDGWLTVGFCGSVS